MSSAQYGVDSVYDAFHRWVVEKERFFPSTEGVAADTVDEFGVTVTAEEAKHRVLGRRVSGHAAGGQGRPPARGPGSHSGVYQVTGYFVPVSRMRNHVS